MAYHERDRDEAISAISTRFKDGEFSETVLRASLYGLRLRGDELEQAVRDILREKDNRP
jgi:hypothetical protein